MTLAPRALLLDNDGCVVSGLGRAALPGAVEAFRVLRRGLPIRFVTNTTSRPRRWLAATLREAGFEVDDDAEFDVAGALDAGVGAGILVRTGKYRPGDESRFDPPPSAVIDSVAELPRLFTG